MMRCALLVLVACSTPSMPDAGSADPIPAGPSAKPKTAAGHAGTIELLAVADGGNAAVSQDSAGGTRLWPTLDGTREPIVVPVAHAMQLALARAGDDYVVVVRDEGAGIEIVHVGVQGVSRARIAPDPPIDSIAIADQGVLALRADQTIAILDWRGDTIARVAS